eukprot:gene1729-33138_t
MSAETSNGDPSPSHIEIQVSNWDLDPSSVQAVLSGGGTTAVVVVQETRDGNMFATPFNLGRDFGIQESINQTLTRILDACQPPRNPVSQEVLDQLPRISIPTFPSQRTVSLSSLISMSYSMSSHPHGRDFGIQESIDQTLTRILDAYQPPRNPVSQEVLDQLPRKAVRSNEGQEVPEGPSPLMDSPYGPVASTSNRGTEIGQSPNPGFAEAILSRFRTMNSTGASSQLIPPTTTAHSGTTTDRAPLSAQETYRQLQDLLATQLSEQAALTVELRSLHEQHDVLLGEYKGESGALHLTRNGDLLATQLSERAALTAELRSLHEQHGVLLGEYDTLRLIGNEAHGMLEAEMERRGRSSAEASNPQIIGSRALGMLRAVMERRARIAGVSSSVDSRPTQAAPQQESRQSSSRRHVVSRCQAQRRRELEQGKGEKEQEQEQSQGGGVSASSSASHPDSPAPTISNTYTTSTVSHPDSPAPTTSHPDSPAPAALSPALTTSHPDSPAPTALAPTLTPSHPDTPLVSQVEAAEPGGVGSGVASQHSQNILSGATEGEGRGSDEAVVTQDATFFPKRLLRATKFFQIGIYRLALAAVLPFRRMYRSLLYSIFGRSSAFEGGSESSARPGQINKAGIKRE